MTNETKLYFLTNRAWHDTIVPGSRIVAVGTRDVRDLTEGKVYTAIYGKEEGIFTSRPFVTVVGDDGIKDSFHLSRFVPEFT